MPIASIGIMAFGILKIWKRQSISDTIQEYYQFAGLVTSQSTSAKSIKINFRKISESSKKYYTFEDIYLLCVI